MPRRSVLHRPRRKVPIGDLRDRVTVHTVTSQPVADGRVEKVFTALFDLDMKVESLGPRLHDFNAVNIEDVPTHRMTCRHVDQITAEKFIEFDGAYFEIKTIENVEGRKEYLILSCRQTGAVDKEASGA